MSLPPQVNSDKSGKHRGAAMKEAVQHSGEVYYSMGPPALEPSQTDSASTSGVYNPEKGLQSLTHYQQAPPVKWMHQEPIQAPGWSQESPQSAWGQNFGPYVSGVNSRGGESQLPANVEPYRDAGQPQGRGLEWEPHAMAAMHQAQLQAYQHAHKGVDLQGQPNVPSHPLQGAMSQPFQTMFRPSKQFSPGYYSFSPGNKGARNMSYNVQSLEPRQEEADAQMFDASAVSKPSPEKFLLHPTEPSDAPQAVPRRSRRLSREGQSPLGPPPTNIWPQESKETSQNGAQSQAATGGVIQITSRRRRASKEINLETLAQQASKMEPAKLTKEDAATGRQAMMLPLIMPVSVPVHRIQPGPQGSWSPGRLRPGEQPVGPSERKPSVIVARRRTLRNSITQSLGQEEETDPELNEDGKSKFKRRPRPGPLIIPPHKPSTFIPPSLYSTISSYQSNLRSPVRLPEHPAALPPYTPPPILSPMREGSGLYCSTFLANIASNQSLPPPPPTPKSATRSLLRSASSEVTPPLLPLNNDATPVSLEPRINIGERYQAEIPVLRDQRNSQLDQHGADLVWQPVDESQLKPSGQQRLDQLMSMACSSVLRGGGTNQELVLHCLHECGGEILETLQRLMLRDPLFPRGHQLAGYHYSGCDCWTAEEKRYFNKGISAYRKDFFMVQKLNSQLSKVTDEDENKDGAYDRGLDSSQQARVAQSLQAHDYAGTMVMIQEPLPVNKEVHPLTAAHRPRPTPTAKKSKEPAKPPQDPEAVFPCKKCGRVFYKVKSRSAHMKSHAEQEKKAAALRQKEEEEQAAAVARARKAAATMAGFQAENGSGVTPQTEASGPEDSSEVEDDDDEDWH
ncbi:unnamed protein product [Tetraodon nigroviridis]|uniref:(spotted green pufferfish) hypothetical protein n=1 Tax=Tetraodon nigroviridis TaxID=99883 RepID=Q4T7L9_TETNG|nr:unnamed protein product [Tetraodon nigroviridis]